VFWLIATIILGLIGAGAVLVFFGSPESRIGAALVAGGCLVLWLGATFFASAHLIGQREVGIVHDFSGTITGKVDPGTSWTAPWQHVKKENVGILTEDFDLGESNSAVSSDQQPIFARITLNYKVDPEHVVDLYRRVGPAWKHTLLESRVLQDFKEVTSGFTAQEITTKRADLREQTKDRLTDELSPYDIEVVDFFVRNIDYSEAYAQSIEAKNRQVQASLQAQAKISQAKAEAEQRVEAAKGEAAAALARATAEAESIRRRGRAIRDNPALLRLEAIQRLSEQASVIICTADRCPSFIPAPQAARP